jgi:thiamine-phosphate pyrophosphorylase
MPPPAHCLLYYITDRTALADDEPTRRCRLLAKIAEAAGVGVDYIQLREKDLPTRELESLAREIVGVVGDTHDNNRETRTALLINSRTDVAFASGADGVHLRSDDVSPQEVRRIWKISDLSTLRKPGSVGHPQLDTLPAPLIAASCHSPAEVAQTAVSGATFAVFAPVFGKKDSLDARPTGLQQLQEACQANIPVLALGGVTLANAAACLEAGAAGIAAIRLFQENDIVEIVRTLRGQN